MVSESPKFGERSLWMFDTSIDWSSGHKGQISFCPFTNLTFQLHKMKFMKIVSTPRITITNIQLMKINMSPTNYSNVKQVPQIDINQSRLAETY